jgi:hypothetical protein
MEPAALKGLSALRWAAWAWMASVLGLRYHDLQRPWLAILLVVAALAYTAIATLWLRQGPARLLALPTVLGELALAAGLVLGDGWVTGAATLSPPRRRWARCGSSAPWKPKLR